MKLRHINTVLKRFHIGLCTCVTSIIITFAFPCFVGCDSDSNIDRDPEVLDYDGVERGMQADAYERAQRNRGQALEGLNDE